MPGIDSLIAIVYRPMVKQFAASFPFFVVGMVASKMLLSPAGDDADGPSFTSVLLHYAGAAAALVARMIGSRMPWLTALGEVSMAIFVLHTIVASVLRTVLGFAGVQDPLILLIICVTGGLLIPVLIAKIASRYRLEVKLGLRKTSHTPRKIGQPTDAPIAS